MNLFTLVITIVNGLYCIHGYKCKLIVLSLI